jgi:site-specific recombinase XerD
MQRSLKQSAANGKLPSTGEMAAFRAYLQGIGAKASVTRFAPALLSEGRNARGVIGDVRRSLIAAARQRHRSDWVDVLTRIAPDSPRRLQQRVESALRELPVVPIPVPQFEDAVSLWFSQRIAHALTSAGIKTLAELVVYKSRRKMWWRSIEGLGQRAALHIDGFVESHPNLAKQAKALLEHLRANTRSPWQVALAVPLDSTEKPRRRSNDDKALVTEMLPWDRAKQASQFDGSRGKLRAPKRGCLLDAGNDYDAVNAWLGLQESVATKRAYRKEVERLMLWAIVERGKPLSSLTSEDAMTYRSFLRRPTPASRWIGPVVSRDSVEWRPFQGPLSIRSMAYALSVLSSLFRWLTEQRYLLGNPFAGITAKASRAATGGAGASIHFSKPRDRAFSTPEWKLIRRWADRAERDFGWTNDAAARLRFILDFMVSTGLRVDELANVKLRELFSVKRTHRWVNVKGKGGKRGAVAIPPLAWDALKLELKRRGISANVTQWPSEAYLVASIDAAIVSTNASTQKKETQRSAGLTAGRIWAILRRLFDQIAERVESKQPHFAEKLRAASPHWLRHTHATLALQGGAELVTVRDNLRHASVTTTSNYLHADETRRARQIAKVFR